MARRRSPAPNGPLVRQAHAILADSSRTLARLERVAARSVAAAAEALITCFEGGGTVFLCGNGGSAADAQHFACELAGRFTRERMALPAVALSTNTSSLTAIANDYGYDQVFARQLEGLGTPGDVLVAITTSGRSPSVSRTVHVAYRLGMIVIGLTGQRGKRFAASCDHALVSPSDSTPRIQEAHIAMAHALCELVERSMFGGSARRRARPVRSASRRKGASRNRARPAAPSARSVARRAPRRAPAKRKARR